jgi:transcriptional regulator with XRE-family HTH domain
MQMTDVDDTINAEREQAAKLRAQGLTQMQIADAMGLTRPSVQRRLRAHDKAQRLDPAIRDHLASKGVTDLSAVHSGWMETKDAAGNKDGNLYFYIGQDEPERFVDVVTDSLSDYKPLDRKLFAPRVNRGAVGDRLLVVDLADVHFGKLATAEETGREYNVEIARHRAVEGTRALLREAQGVGRVLFVMGNDILHTDNGKTTTSGTAQDTDGTYFTAWRAAQHATIDAISECAAVAETDLIHCMSNHDWRSGWALSQTIAAAVRNHEGIRATNYNMSERHRKYYGYGRNGIMVTHGDGAKEESLTSLFLKEGRNLISECDLLYAYLHHFHHKIRNRRGVDVFQSEKDHTAFTKINMGAARVEGSDLMAEYVRSPSAPDGWHDRNGYINRQAVEVFLHCPHDGQKGRFTEWF